MVRTATMGLLLCFFFTKNLAFGQINGFPYSQNFEEAFVSGSPVLFLPHWWGNEVSSGSRIYRSPAGGRNGSAALATEPTSTFSPEVRLLLDGRTLSGAEISFWARSAKNGTGTRASQLLLSFSVDGGTTFSSPNVVGAADAFPNADGEYQEFTYSLPAALLQTSEAVVRWQVRRMEEGAGTAARILLDDVQLTPANVALQLLSAQVQSATEVLLDFNLPLDKASAENIANYSLAPAATITAAKVSSTNSKQVKLEMAGLNPGSYTLTATGILPANGDEPLQAATLSFSYSPAPAFREVVINEIFADPNPKGSVQPQPVILPTAADAEFVELFNASASAYNLQELRLNGGKLPPFVLQPQAYVILVPAGKGQLYEGYGSVAEVQGWKSLSNSGTQLQLMHAGSGVVLDSLSYSLSWYREAGKQEGGWSLEQINPYSACSQAGNWRASSDFKGATPGAPNTVLDTTPDTRAPQLLQAVATAQQQVVLVFDEYVSPTSVAAARVVLAPAVPVSALQHQGQRVLVQLAASLQEEVSYNIQLSGISDCSGNKVEATVPLIKPKPAEAGDLVINELMYNPLAGGADWVELYNTTAAWVNLQGWYLGLREGRLKTSAVVSKELWLLPPKGFAVITSDPEAVLAHFPDTPPQSLLQLNGFPSLRNSGDTLVLLNPQFQPIELVAYSDAHHHPLLSDRKGVALERIDPARPALTPANWTSAASPAWGTPGKVNSQYRNSESAVSALKIDPEVIEPTPDGVADVALIHYQLTGAGQSGTLFIFDAGGREVTRLANNQVLGQTGVFQWNGTNSQGERVRNGYYIVVLSVFGTDGQLQQWRKTMVVTNWY